MDTPPFPFETVVSYIPYFLLMFGHVHKEHKLLRTCTYAAKRLGITLRKALETKCSIGQTLAKFYLAPDKAPTPSSMEELLRRGGIYNVYHRGDFRFCGTGCLARSEPEQRRKGKCKKTKHCGVTCSHAYVVHVDVVADTATIYHSYIGQFSLRTVVLQRSEFNELVVLCTKHVEYWNLLFGVDEPILSDNMVTDVEFVSDTPDYSFPWHRMVEIAGQNVYQNCGPKDLDPASGICADEYNTTIMGTFNNVNWAKLMFETIRLLN